MKRFGLPAVVILLIFTVNSFGQSLAEIAKRERERQKAAKTKIVVTNNESVAAAPAPVKTPPTAPATTQAASSAAAQPAGPTDNNGRDEKYWRGLFQKARDDAKRAQDRAVLLDLRMKDLNTQLLRQSDVYNRENRIGPEMATVQKDLEDANKEAAAAQQKITDLEDELRKSGGPAGWAR
jgi:hypothetical protein